MIRWHLSPQGFKRFRLGHPWVFSNELSHSPKGIEPGSEVELQSPEGKFLAWGYANPHSLIAFRVVDRSIKTADTERLIRKKLEQALGLRRRIGRADVSHRLCFSEADGLPGLVIDTYMGREHRAVAIEILTAGAEKWVASLQDRLLDIFAELYGDGKPLTLILHRDSPFRVLEGVAVEKPRILGALAEKDLDEFQFSLPHLSEKKFFLQSHLISGQKTGFFLDQNDNVLNLLRLVSSRTDTGPAPLRVLDLCCYVGRWGTQVGAFLDSRGVKSEVTYFDSSARALESAMTNAAIHGLAAKSVHGDVLKDLQDLPERSFDIVVCDPPAFIKSKKNKIQGIKGYEKLNRLAMEKVRPRGLFVSCSCSANLSEEEFEQVLRHSGRDFGFSWLHRGQQGFDHPVLMEFPEGKYLKCWIGERQG